MIHHNFDRRLLLVVLLVVLPTLVWSQDKTATPPAKAAARANQIPQTLEELRALEQQVKQVIDRVTPAVVGIAGGSGVVIDADGHVLTAGHVGGRSGRDVTVTFADGKRLRGQTLGNNRGIDSGLAKLAQEGDWSHVEMGKSADVAVGQWCLAIGFPASFSRAKPPPVRIGRVLAVSERMIVTDCPLMGGDSGGPLFDLQGKVIGINSRVGGAVIANLHVPVDAYRKEWDRLVAGEDWNDRQPKDKPQQRKRPPKGKSDSPKPNEPKPNEPKPNEPKQAPAPKSASDERPPEPKPREQDTAAAGQQVSLWQPDSARYAPCVSCRRRHLVTSLPAGFPRC